MQAIETTPETANDFDSRKALLRQQIEKEVLRKSPYMLGKSVLGFTKYCNTHKEWDKWIRTNIDLTCKKQSKSLILMPRGTYKTTMFSINLPVNILLNNPNISLLIASSTSSNATNIVRQIRTILERNEKLIALYGNFISKDMWGTNEFNIAQRNDFTSKEPNVTGIGKGSILTSRHFDLILADDICSSEDRDSQAARDSTQLWFTDLWDLLKPTGQLIVVGTRWHKRDLYYHILENVNPELEKTKKFNIIIRPAHNEQGQLNFPDILSEDKLTELKAVKIGEDAMSNSEFEAQYELRPIASGDQIFKEFHYYNHAATEYDIFIMWTDPALSMKTNACYSAIVLVGRIKSGQYKGKWGCAYASLEKRQPTKLMADVIRIHKSFTELYKCDVACFMEDNGFQSLLKDNTIKLAIQGGYNLPITGKTATENKDMRISSMEPYITQGFLLFRDDWKQAPEGYRLLMDQLLNFPQLEKDGPDALAGAHSISKGRYYNMELTEVKNENPNPN